MPRLNALLVSLLLWNSCSFTCLFQSPWNYLTITYARSILRLRTVKAAIYQGKGLPQTSTARPAKKPHTNQRRVFFRPLSSAITQQSSSAETSSPPKRMSMSSMRLLETTERWWMLLATSRAEGRTFWVHICSFRR